MLKIETTGNYPKKRVFIQGFTVSSGAQVMPFSLFSLGLLSSSFCIENGENNEKSNHMLSATSDIDLEFLTNFLNVKIAMSVVPEGAVTNFRTFVIYSRNQMLGGFEVDRLCPIFLSSIESTLLFIRQTQSFLKCLCKQNIFECPRKSS